MHPLPTLGILGATPKPLPGPLFRASRLADLERHAGALGLGSYLVGHAAAAAFIGGVGQVAVATVPGFDDPEVLVAAVRLLLASGASCIVAPGLAELAPQRALLGAFEDWRDAEDAPAHAAHATLWLDAPLHATVTEAIAHRDALGGDRRAVWVGLPAVRALAPGRPRADLVPASAVIAALALGTAPALGPLVSVERRLDAAELDALAAAGGLGALVGLGPRQLVALRADPPRVPPPPADEIAEDAPDPIARAVRAAAAPVLADPPRDPRALGPALERAVRPALRRLVASGAVTGFAVQFEEGVLAVWLKETDRVREVRVVTHPVE